MWRGGTLISIWDWCQWQASNGWEPEPGKGVQTSRVVSLMPFLERPSSPWTTHSPWPWLLPSFISWSPLAFSFKQTNINQQSLSLLYAQKSNYGASLWSCHSLAHLLSQALLPHGPQNEVQTGTQPNAIASFSMMLSLASSQRSDHAQCCLGLCVFAKPFPLPGCLPSLSSVRSSGSAPQV